MTEREARDAARNPVSSFFDGLDDDTRAVFRKEYEAGMSDPDDDCPCFVCIGRRSFAAYERTGKEPFWPAVRLWRARQNWLANATVTTRRGLRGDPPKRDET